MKKPLAYLFFGFLLLLMQSAAVYAQKLAKHQKITAHRPVSGDEPTVPLPLGQLFVGRWEWADGGEVFHLTITRNPTYIFAEFPNLPPRNVIICQFVYRRNGVVVDQSLTTGRLPYAALGSPANNSTIRMLFYEHGTKGFGYLTLSIDPTDKNEISWLLEPRETNYRNPADRPAIPFLMPTTMTLTRQ